MRLGSIRPRQITQQWVSLSVGGMEFIDGCDFIRSDGNKSRISMLATGGNISFHQLFRFFSSKDSDSKSIATTTTMTSKSKKIDVTPPDQPSNVSPSSKYSSDRKPNDSLTTTTRSTSFPIGTSDALTREDVKPLDMKRSHEHRRLIVRRSAINDDYDAEALNKSLFHRSQRVGTVNRRLPLENEISDSGGKTIWIPNRKSEKENDCIAETQQLPQINASALLDPSTYCRGGGQTIAGTVAARQLLHGRKELMEVLGRVVYSSTSRLVRQHRSIVLHGHGVPSQLLQHHIDSADKLLLHVRASEVGFKKFNVTQHSNVTTTVDAVRDIGWVHVRDVETGENRAIAWPIEDVVDWEYNLQLYWTVMNRIATLLGLRVLLKQPQAKLPKPETSHRRPRADYGDPTLNSMLNVPPHHWRVKFSRDLHFTPDQLPIVRPHIYPVIEWTPLEGVASPGHVCVRLQGQATRGNGDVPISLCFSAVFRSNAAPSTD